MRLEKVSLADTGAFSASFLDYLLQKESLKSHVGHFPQIANFRKQIAEKSSFPVGNRNILTERLKHQYQTLVHPDAVKENILSLTSEKTFTVTTGHQLNIFTGPLYFIYKIATAIKTCLELSKAYPEYKFVPVYWMASEDHDFEEISYFYLYDKKYTWSTTQKGAVGRFNPNELSALLSEIPGDITAFREAYLKHKTLSDAVRFYVNKLFGAHGLVVVDADDPALKKQLKAVMNDDLFDHTPQKFIDVSSQQLEKSGYKPQVNARPINLFYLDNGIRSRIEADGNEFMVVDSPLRFSKEQMSALIEKEPEKLSPNVVLRPLYQELILPNLAYIGGPAELVYWLQLKGMFDHYTVAFPILMPRNFALVIDAPTARKLEKTGLEASSYFKPKNALFNQWVSEHSTHSINLANEVQVIQASFHKVNSQAAAIDKSLGPMVDAEAKKTMDQLEKIQARLLRAEKRLHTDKLRQIEAVKDRLFPGGGLQERRDNFLNFFQTDSAFINKLIQKFDPFDFRFNVLTYDDEGSAS